jgi:TRAP-type C4-dicarboxylate transport system substrate-binding protein
MRRAATKPTTQHSSKRTTHQPAPAQGQITSAQVWRQLSATQQQVLQRTITSVCRSLANQAANEEAHDDQS